MNLLAHRLERFGFKQADKGDRCLTRDYSPLSLASKQRRALGCQAYQLLRWQSASPQMAVDSFSSLLRGSHEIMGPSSPPLFCFGVVSRVV